MIELVLDEEGNVLHDCEAAQCAVSWDGYVRVPRVDLPEYEDENEKLVPAQVKRRGERVPLAQDPDARIYEVRNGVAHRRK